MNFMKIETFVTIGLPVVLYMVLERDDIVREGHIL